ncbi:MAG: tetratricopeptide repeat protein [Vicinamibacterales bacterium]
MRSRWLPLAAAVLACAAYFNVLDNPFVYDDHDTVTGNRSLIDPSNFRFVLLYTPFRPLVNASYAFDRLLWDYRPAGYHLTNIALHAIVVVLLYAWIRRLIEDSGAEADSRGPAFVGAVLFAVHPLQTEAVGYVSGRSEVMCAVFFIGALLLSRHAIVTERRIRGALGIGCGILALASKETAIVLPLVFLAYDWLLRPGADAGRVRRLTRVCVPLFLVFAVAGVYRLSMLRVSTAGPSSAVLNAETQAIVIWRYAGLLVWPFGQSIMHSVHRVTAVADPLALIAVLAIALAIALAVRIRRSHPIVALGILWFFVVLAPSSSVIPLREGMAEHRAYLASAGFFMTIAGVLQPWWRRLSNRSWVPRLAVAVLVVVLCLLTAWRNAVWSDPVTLWAEATVHAEDMWEPHYALADSLREEGQCGEAISEYRKVVALRPAHRDAHTNLGICLAQDGQRREAERAFRQALAIDPRFARGYTNLGALALLDGDTGRARDFYLEALVVDPDNVLARMQLASLYEHTFHDYHAAARMCGEARLVAPATPGVVDCVERNQRLASAQGR